MFNKLKEWLFNTPTFNKYAQAELNAKEIEPSEGVKKMEHSRQTIKRIGTLVLVLGIVVVGVVTFLNAKNKTDSQEPKTAQNAQKEPEKENTVISSTEERKSDYLIKTSADDRMNDAYAAFESFLASYDEGETIMEINMKDFESGNVSYDSDKLRTIYVNALKEKFGDTVSENGYADFVKASQSGQWVIHKDQGLTFIPDGVDEKSKQQSKIPLFIVDMEKPVDNTKILLTKDFEHEAENWREAIKKYPQFSTVFSPIEWETDLSYEVVPVNLGNTNKYIASVSAVFVLMHYNENLEKWQIEGLGGVE